MLYELVLSLKLLYSHILCSVLNGLCWPVKLSATFPWSRFLRYMRFIYRSSEREKRKRSALIFPFLLLRALEARPNKGRLPSVLDLIYQWEKIPGARKIKLQYS